MKKPAPAKATRKAPSSRSAKSKNPGGRPPKLQPDARTLTTIGGLGEINATHAESAAVLGVSRETFEKFLGKHKKAAEAFESGKAEGRVSLRRAQYKAALAGNATMQIWLGKQLLAQKDKHEVGGDPDRPIKHHHVPAMTAKEAADAYAALIRGNG